MRRHTRTHTCPHTQYQMLPIIATPCSNSDSSLIFSNTPFRQLASRPLSFARRRCVASITCSDTTSWCSTASLIHISRRFVTCESADSTSITRNPCSCNSRTRCMIWAHVLEKETEVPPNLSTTNLLASATAGIRRAPSSEPGLPRPVRMCHPLQYQAQDECKTSHVHARACLGMRALRLRIGARTLALTANKSIRKAVSHKCGRRAMAHESPDAQSDVVSDICSVLLCEVCTHTRHTRKNTLSPISTHTYTRVNKFIYIYHIYVSMLYVYTHRNTHMYTNLHVHAHTNSCTRNQTCAHTHTYMGVSPSAKTRVSVPAQRFVV